MSASDPARRVLVLDDDELVGLLIETVARLHGIECRVTTRPEDFFAAIDAWQPTHLVIDLTLSGTSGEAVVRRLGEQGCRARIIIASGVDLHRLAQAGALVGETSMVLAGTLRKPFLPTTLRAMLTAG